MFFRSFCYILYQLIYAVILECLGKSNWRISEIMLQLDNSKKYDDDIYDEDGAKLIYFFGLATKLAFLILSKKCPRISRMYISVELMLIALNQCFIKEVRLET